MSIIKRLSDNIAQLATFIERDEAILFNDPNNFAAKLSVKSLKSQLDDLRKQLFIENTKRQKEVISLRFIGEEAKFGSIPLLSLGGLTDAFAGAIFEMSKFSQFGKRGGKKVNKIVKDSLDLRLNAIGAGSTILYISAKTSPDLFGESLTQQTFDNFLDFVSSENADAMIEKISEVGTASIKHYASFFKRLNEDNLEIDITVNSPFREQSLTWNGSSEKIISLYAALSTLNVSDPSPIEFEGEVISLSKKGTIEILSNNGYNYRAKYPEAMLDAIVNLHIGQICNGRFLKTTVINSVSGKEKMEFDLIEITQ